MPITRRDWLAITAAAILPGCSRTPPTPAPGPAAPPAPYPGKIPAMRVVKDAPACLETPWAVFREDITPTDAFYVRWNAPPPTVDLATWRLRIDGAVATPLELSMADLLRLGSEDLIAVNQCSGNSRSFVSPTVAGTAWRNGAMGNGRWTGVSLAKVLRKAGITADAVEVVFDGLDEATAAHPDFVKSLPVVHALTPDVMIAHALNGNPLPVLNGFPARLVVPGWFATYWVKALYRITVLPKAFDGYWMMKTYRIPATPDGVEEPGKLQPATVPITALNVRSFFTTPKDNATVPAGKPVALDGIAFDGGRGIGTVEVSADRGVTWVATTLDAELGRYAFRRWRHAWTPPPTRGPFKLQVRATNRDGQTQPGVAGWNREGYMRNVVEELTLRVQ